LKLIFEKSVPSRRAVRPPAGGVRTKPRIESDLLRDRPTPLPELSHLDVIRHFTELSRRNFGVDTGFYPLGSCTMKHNPKLGERLARDPRWTGLHPGLTQLPGGAGFCQGALRVLHETAELLSEICGMAAFTTQPMAGAHGELTGALLIAAYHADRGNDKRTILVPDSAHGTNPASATAAGYEVRTIPSDETGTIDMDALREAATDDVAGLMLTVPNTLGLFNPRVKEVCDLIHDVDGVTYCDGANLNAMLARARPGEMGFDIVHTNLHKTFSTPHGGGGPGAGPVGVCERLVEYLPTPIVRREDDGRFSLDYDRPKSIGPVAAFCGSFGVILRAYAYILLLGEDGLRRVSEHAVLNANYVREKLREHYHLPYGQVCKHECVFSAARQAEMNVRAIDIAKALIDRGFHPPTVYFPLIVPEAMMIEPTETESKETLDAFIQTMIEIAELARSDPEKVTSCPKTTVVGRLDETRAARRPDLSYRPPQEAPVVG